MKPFIQIGSIGLDPIHIGLFCLAVGLVILGLVLRSKDQTALQQTTADLKYAESERDRLERELEKTGQQLVTQQRQAKDYEVELAKETAKGEETAKRLEELAGTAVLKAQATFSETADRKFADLIKPISENFAKFEKKVGELGEDRAAMREKLDNTGSMLKETREETSKLVRALSAPTGGGRWGEQSLENILQNAGMQKGIDFLIQPPIGNLRPDVVINLPNGRKVVVDAKVSASEFLKASEAESAEIADQHLAQHAAHVKAQFKRLSAKDYQDEIKNTADFVVMYVPGENMFSAALKHEPALLEKAFSHNVIIASPAILISLVKTIALGWREEHLAKNAQEVADLARALYKALTGFGGKVQKIGTNIDRTMRAYNDMVGSLERTVLPKGRKFVDLGVIDGATEIAPLDGLDGTPRMLRLEGDMELDVIDADGDASDVAAE